MPAIKFPFVRESWYILKDLEVFVGLLSVARSEDKQLDDDLRLSKGSWMKLLNEELHPLRHFAKKFHIAESAQFRICAEGAAADIELRDGSGIRRFQVTTAGPILTSKNPHWGHVHKSEMRRLNKKGQASGWGPDFGERIATKERNLAYLAGLVKALERKKDHRISDCDLIVHAVAYNEAMNLQTFMSLANEALNRVQIRNFRSIYILDSGEGYLVERVQ